MTYVQQIFNDVEILSDDMQNERSVNMLSNILNDNVMNVELADFVLRNSSKVGSLLFAFKIIHNYILNGWNINSKNDAIKDLIIQSLDSSLPNICERASECLAMIGSKEILTNWNNFIDSCLQTSEGKGCGVLYYFLELLENNDGKVFPYGNGKGIKELFMKQISHISEYTVNSSPSSTANRLLKKILSFIKWDYIKDCEFGNIIDSEGEYLFTTLCLLLQVNDSPKDFILTVFNKLSSLNIADYNELCNALIKNHHLLCQQVSPVIDHYKRMVLSIVENCEYFGILDFLVELTNLIYRDKVNDGLEWYAMCDVTNKVKYDMFHMVYEYPPPSFNDPYDSEFNYDEEGFSLYNKVRQFVINVSVISPKDELQNDISNMFTELRELLSKQKDGVNLLKSITFTIACVINSGFNDECIYAIEVFQLYLELLDKRMQIDKKVVASCLLFIFCEFSKAKKVTSKFAKEIFRLALTGLSNHHLRKISSRAILFSGEYIADLLPEEFIQEERIMVYLKNIDQLGNLVLPVDVYANVIQGFAYIHNSKPKLLQVLLKMISKIILEAKELLETGNQSGIKLIISPIIALRVVSKVNMKSVISIVKDMHMILEHFTDRVIELLEQNENNDVLTMYIKELTLLFSSIVYRKPDILFKFYGSSTTHMFIEILNLADVCLKGKITEELTTLIFSEVLIPTINAIQYNIEEYREHTKYIPKIISTISQNHFNLILSTVDSSSSVNLVQFLISQMETLEENSILSALSAFETLINNADKKLLGEERLFFTYHIVDIIATAMKVFVSPYTKSCFNNLSQFITKTVHFVASGRVNCETFDSQNIYFKQQLTEKISQFKSDINYNDVSEFVNLVLTHCSIPVRSDNAKEVEEHKTKLNDIMIMLVSILNT